MVIGNSYKERITIDSETVEQFRAMSGDDNPIHVDRVFANEHGFSRPVAHGAILLTVLSRIIGTKLPGPGSVWLEQQTEWVNPVLVGDELEVSVTVVTYSQSVNIAELDVEVKSGENKIVMKGKAKVKVSDKIASAQAEPSTGKRVALITGGSRGIGAETARRLAGDGWITAINYRVSVNAVAELVNDIEEEGGDARPFRADVSVPEAADELMQEVIAQCGSVDAVVHCATPPIEKIDIGKSTYKNFSSYMDTYVGGAICLMRGAIPVMTECKFGRIVFLGTSALFGVPPAGWSAYITAKGALESLMRCAAVELGPSGITVNMVSPSLTITELTEDIPLRMKEIEARRSPIRRLATPEDTANTIAFLLSDQAGYINGANLPLTGGPL